MTTKVQSASQPRSRAKANPNWGLGYSLVHIAAIIAAYHITAPPALTPGVNYFDRVQRDDLAALDPAPAAAGSIDPRTKSVLDYLVVHARVDAGSASLAPNAGANPQVQAILEYLRAHQPAAEPKPEFNWLTSAPTIVMPTQPVNWLTGAPSTDLPTQAWDASHYPHLDQ
jgi:hypothetical protein